MQGARIHLIRVTVGLMPQLSSPSVRDNASAVPLMYFCKR